RCRRNSHLPKRSTRIRGGVRQSRIFSLDARARALPQTRRIRSRSQVTTMHLSVLLLAAATLPPVNDGYGDMVYVPAGAFRMGDNFGDGEPRERPVHMVELDAFYIGKLEMTNGEWKKFRDDAGYDDPKLWPNGYVVPKN